MWGILRRSSRATATLSAPLVDHVKLFESRGDDLTVAVRQEFFQTQQALMSYRKEKFFEELAYFRSGAGVSLAALSSKNVVAFVRNVTRLMFAFMFMLMLGRGSIYPLLEPSSPMLEGLKYCNPNAVPQCYVSAVMGDCHQ